MRWTTGIGIVLGGTGGALAALLGAPQPPVAIAPAPRQAASIDAASEARSLASATSGVPAPSAVVPELATSTSPAEPAASVAAVTSAVAPVAGARPTPALEVPTTAEARLKAELLCDQKKDFDECSRAALAHESGSAGQVSVEQAKRFRRIALTHLVAQCEAGSPHACFVLAAKYRAGTELYAKPNAAATLERRGLELCRKRRAPECP